MKQLIKPHLSSAGRSDKEERRTYGLTVEEFLDNAAAERIAAVANAFIGGIKVRAMTEAEATQRCHGLLGSEYGSARTLTGDLHRDSENRLDD